MHYYQTSGQRGYPSYLDGASWVHKTDPCQQERTPRTCMWRKKREGLHQECSTKDKKEGTVGRMAKFMVVISHGRVMNEFFQYEGNIKRVLFSQFVRDRFPHFFGKGNNLKGKMFLKDKDPSQN